MPYRRLPNTDQARMRALKEGTEKGREMAMQDLPFSFSLLSTASTFLRKFEAAHIYYNQCYSKQITNSKRHRMNAKNAKLYISHFIQVLNLSIIRNEIKVSTKDLYGLPRDTHTLPDLSTDASILEWGEKTIAGENKRLMAGGIPIYNPTIAKVSVHYNLFKESYADQKDFQAITNRSLEQLTAMRSEADSIILKMWNQIEKKYEYLPLPARLDKCRHFGVIYYYRTGEKAID